MSYHVEENQKVLFAATFNGGAYVIAVKGRAAQVEIENYSDCMEDLLWHSQMKDQCPHPGLYVWEGKVCVETGGWCGSEPVEPEIEFEGRIRPATYADFNAFGGCISNSLPVLIVPKPAPVEIESCTSSPEETSGAT